MTDKKRKYTQDEAHLRTMCLEVIQSITEKETFTPEKKLEMISLLVIGTLKEIE